MRDIPPIIPPPLAYPLKEFQGSHDGRVGDYLADIPQRYNPTLRAICSRVGAQFISAWDAYMTYPRKEELWSQKSTYVRAHGEVNFPFLHWHCENNTKVSQAARAENIHPA